MTELNWLYHFSRNLQMELDKRKWTQCDLAKRSHVSTSAINRYIKGVQVPNLIVASNICYALGICIDDLVGFDEPIGWEDEDGSVRPRRF